MGERRRFRIGYSISVLNQSPERIIIGKKYITLKDEDVSLLGE